MKRKHAQRRGKGFTCHVAFDTGTGVLAGPRHMVEALKQDAFPPGTGPGWPWENAMAGFGQFLFRENHGFFGRNMMFFWENHGTSPGKMAGSKWEKWGKRLKCWDPWLVSRSETIQKHSDGGLSIVFLLSFWRCYQDHIEISPSNLRMNIEGLQAAQELEILKEQIISTIKKQAWLGWL